MIKCEPSRTRTVMNKKAGLAAIVIGVLTVTVPTFILFQAVTYLFVVPLALGIFCIGLGVIFRRTESRFLRGVGWIAVIIMLYAIVLPFGLIAYLNRLGYPIELVIPDGYRGRVRFVIDRTQGVHVQLKDGKYTYHIPQSGTLIIKDDGPFRQWHSLTAVYANGMPIPNDYKDNLPADAVTLHSLGAGVRGQGSEREEFFEKFVGANAERRKYGDQK